MGPDKKVHAEVTPQISEELNEEEIKLPGQNSSKQITILGDPTFFNEMLRNAVRKSKARQTNGYRIIC